MKNSLIAIAFVIASVPMFAANQAAGQANPPAAGTTGTTATTTTGKTAVKAKKHSTKVKKSAKVKKDATTTPVAK